jgi:hypothetical protein
MDNNQNLPYIKFNDIEFESKSHKSFCKKLMDEISRLETAVMFDEELVDQLKLLVENNKMSVALPAQVVSFNKKILFATKILFWYHTGIESNKVIYDVKSEDEIDIFKV